MGGFERHLVLFAAVRDVKFNDAALSRMVLSRRPIPEATQTAAAVTFGYHRKADFNACLITCRNLSQQLAPRATDGGGTREQGFIATIIKWAYVTGRT